MTPRLHEGALAPRATAPAPAKPRLWSGSGHWQRRPSILQAAQTDAPADGALMSIFGAGCMVTPAEMKAVKRGLDIQPVMSRPAALNESLRRVFPEAVPDDPAPPGCVITLRPPRRGSGTCNEIQANGRKRRRRERGGAMLELVLLAPWIFFLFAGALDCGYYAYALISMQSAARVAALYASTNASTAVDNSTACSYVLQELRALPNVGSSISTCTANPVTVTAQFQNGSDGTAASVVSVTYQSLPLIPIPGLLQGSYTWTRAVKMRLRG